MNAPVRQLHPIFLVALGGGLGSLARVQLSEIFAARLASWIGTSTVNLLGCFIAGFVWARLTRLSPDEHRVRHLQWSAFLITGFCGGFTTFSGFGLQTAILAGGGHLDSALWNFWNALVATVFAAMLGVALGKGLARVGL